MARLAGRVVRLAFGDGSLRLPSYVPAAWLMPALGDAN